MPSGKIRVPRLVLQEGRAARHGGAADRSGQMPEQAPSDARIIDDGQFRGLRPSGIESRDGPLAGAAADDRRIIQVGQVDGGMVVVVALHCRAGARQRTGRNRVAGSDMTAGKSGGCDQVCLGPAEACLSAFGVGDSRHRKRRLLGDGSATDERLGVGLARILEVERNGLRRRGGVGEPGIGILGHHARHRDGTFGEFGEAGRIDGAGRDNRGTLTQKHPQPEITAFRALHVLGLAEPALHPERRAGDQHRIRRIRSGGARAGDQVGKEFKRVGRHDCGSTVASRAVPLRSIQPATNMARASDPLCTDGQVP